MDKLVGMGASSMQGVGDSQGGFFKRLESKLADASWPHECFNCGVAGDTTRDMLARFGPVRAHLPAKGIVFLGSNDVPREGDEEPAKRTQPKEFARNVTTLLHALSESPTIYVSSFAVCARRTGIQPEIFAEYSRLAAEIAASLGLTVWDLHTESRAFDDWYLDPDGMHGNDACHEMIADRLFGMMRKRDE
jgi:lysophospholipase L1-like esterase